MGKRCCAITTSLAALVVLGLCLAVPLASHHATPSVSDRRSASLCHVTSYPSVCNRTLAGGTYSAGSVTELAVRAASAGVDQTQNAILAFGSATDPAVDVCWETLAMSRRYTADALRKLQAYNESTRDGDMDDVKAWMSAAMEFHRTCVGAAKAAFAVEVGMYTDQLFSNALAFVNAFAKYGEDVTTWESTVFSFPGEERGLEGPRFEHRKLLADAVPAWMDVETEEERWTGTTWYDVVVAKDGSGDFDTIQAAVEAHARNQARLVVYVKAGVYDEQVNVSATCEFLSIVGDGDATVITGDRNVARMPGMATFNTATLIVAGKGFLGKSFKVQNTAGPEGQQAVAFRGSADMIAFYRVTFDGHQDTLYAHGGRQYYRECTILGTVDFVFGNAAAAFQSCTLVAKKTTILGQQNTYCAHGRADPHECTGLSFQNCLFDGTPELQSDPTSYPTFLGRPWGSHAVCVVLKSELRGHIDRAGWMPWNASTYGLYTSFLAEYQSLGEGTAPAARANWSHQIERASVAERYTANSLVQTGKWIHGYNVPLTGDL